MTTRGIWQLAYRVARMERRRLNSGLGKIGHVFSQEFAKYVNLASYWLAWQG